MTDMYDHIHAYFNGHDRFHFPYSKKELREITGSNGLYVLFEKGEKYKSYDRIVRIGSHDAKDRLINRLDNHFISRNHRKSVFRKHLGRCFLRISNDDYIEHWNRPFKSKVEKEIHGKYVDLKYEESYEEKVSEHIQEKMSFAVIPNVMDQQHRDRIEAGLISTLNQSALKGSSKKWLGNWHPDPRIVNAKIWNIEYLNHRPFEYDEFKKLVER